MTHSEVEVAGIDESGNARSELTLEYVDQVRVRAQRYVQEPADGTWHDLVQALARTFGDTEAYDILRAAEIHHRIRLRR
ncbi:MAG: hypothetical protein ABIO99_11515 [Candidatus Limnocylindria bacterium]